MQNFFYDLIITPLILEYDKDFMEKFNIIKDFFSKKNIKIDIFGFINIDSKAKLDNVKKILNISKTMMFYTMTQHIYPTGILNRYSTLLGISSIMKKPIDYSQIKEKVQKIFNYIDTLSIDTPTKFEIFYIIMSDGIKFKEKTKEKEEKGSKSQPGTYYYFSFKYHPDKRSDNINNIKNIGNIMRKITENKEYTEEIEKRNPIEIYKIYTYDKFTIENAIACINKYDIKFIEEYLINL